LYFLSLGSGLYFVSLDPITIASGEDPILLRMVISASGYEIKQFETYLAVDPDTLEKEKEKGVERIHLGIIMIAIISTIEGIGIVSAAINLFLKKRQESDKYTYL